MPSTIAIAALFASASSEAQRALLGMRTTSDAQAALDVLKQASNAEVTLRLIAAKTIARFRGRKFAELIDA